MSCFCFGGTIPSFFILPRYSPVIFRDLLKLLIPNATDLAEIEIISSPVNLRTLLPLHKDPIGNFFATIHITKVYTSKNLLDQLRELGNFKGVYGNMDSEEIRRYKTYGVLRIEDKMEGEIIKV